MYYSLDFACQKPKNWQEADNLGIGSAVEVFVGLAVSGGGAGINWLRVRTAIGSTEFSWLAVSLQLFGLGAWY